jgi:hypothetical protein
LSIDDNAAVSEVPSDRDIVAAVSDRAITDDSNDEREIGVCELESERQIVTTKDALRAFKVSTQYYAAHGADDNLDVKLYCIDKDLQRRVSNAKKQTNITDFFTLKQKKMCNVCFWMCQMYLFMDMYMYNKTENLSNLGGMNSNVILNII